MSTSRPNGKLGRRRHSPHTAPAATNVQADPTDLREQLSRLGAENAALRAELEALARAPVATGAPAPSARRRWLGRGIALILAVIVFALGVGYAHWAGSEVAAGFRDHYDPAAVSAPPSPPSPSPPPPAPAQAPR